MKFSELLENKGISVKGRQASIDKLLASITSDLKKTGVNLNEDAKSALKFVVTDAYDQGWDAGFKQGSK